MIRESIQKRLVTLAWSQYRLAKESGVAQPTINRFLGGKITLGSDNLERVLSALKLKIK